MAPAPKRLGGPQAPTLFRSGCRASIRCGCRGIAGRSGRRSPALGCRPASADTAGNRFLQHDAFPVSKTESATHTTFNNLELRLLHISRTAGVGAGFGALEPSACANGSPTRIEMLVTPRIHRSESCRPLKPPRFAWMTTPGPSQMVRLLASYS